MRSSNLVLLPRAPRARVGDNTQPAEDAHPIRNIAITAAVTLVCAYFIFPIAKASILARLAHEKAMLSV